MKLDALTIVGSYEEKGKSSGTAKFTNKYGEVSFKLTEEHIAYITQYLMDYCKKVAGEV